MNFLRQTGCIKQFWCLNRSMQSHLTSVTIRSITFSAHQMCMCPSQNSLTKFRSMSTVSIPDPPLPPMDSVSLNILGEPTFASLGLNSYWPSGWYQAVLETLHVSLELPWWAAIAASTLFIRLCLFPFMISQRRQLAKYTDSMPQFTLLQERLTNARLAGNYVEVMRVSQEMQQFMKDHDVNPFKSLKLLFIQVPVFLSVFSGLRGMALLPVESMQTGGLSWFFDLTQSDPYYLLPLLSMASILIVFETGAESASTNLTPLMRTVMRSFPVVGFFMVMNMPAALLWYWTISNFISLVQAQILRIPVVRNYLKLPFVKPAPKSDQNKRGLITGFKESMSNTRLLAELDARERLDAKAWQNAGMKRPPVTFTYDPTKLKQSLIQKQAIQTNGKIVNPEENDTSIKKKTYGQ